MRKQEKIINEGNPSLKSGFIKSARLGRKVIARERSDRSNLVIDEK